MGLHTGEVDERRGDYFGQTVNQSAWPLAVEHGGQVLVSAATREVLGRGSPEDRGLRDPGEHLLEDPTGAVRVFQLTHPELAGPFPPLQTVEPARNSLPVQLTSFGGRHHQLAEVDMLRGARLVTLTGAGGCDKTRLAAESCLSAG